MLALGPHRKGISAVEQVQSPSFEIDPNGAL